MTIGVCDWGVGGMGFYCLLRESRPDLDVLYLGDQGVPGYGKLPRPVLAARVRSILDEFRRRGAERVVVACNAASTVLDPADSYATGMILPTLASVGASPLDLRSEKSPLERRIGVVGGRRTVLSGAYAQPLRSAGWTVVNRIAQPLSGLIEAGMAGAPETEEALDAILRPLRGVDALILACTHYIVLEPAIRARLPRVRIVDPATLAWSAFASDLPPAQGRVGATRFLTTGDPAQMTEAARVAFGVECSPERIAL